MASRIRRSLPCIVLGHARRNIIRDAGIQAPVAATQHVDVPTFLHAKTVTQNRPFGRFRLWRASRVKQPGKRVIHGLFQGLKFMRFRGTETGVKTMHNFVYI